MISKYWYQVESHPEELASQIEAEFDNRSGRAKARRYAKQISAIKTNIDFVINGYDISETWRNGKKQ